MLYNQRQHLKSTKQETCMRKPAHNWTHMTLSSKKIYIYLYQFMLSLEVKPTSLALSVIVIFSMNYKEAINIIFRI